jgi:hypothetical protein
VHVGFSDILPKSCQSVPPNIAVTPGLDPGSSFFLLHSTEEKLDPGSGAGVTGTGNRIAKMEHGELYLFLTFEKLEDR